VDTRYSTIGYTSLFELQQSNGIYEKMAEKFPQYMADDDLSNIAIRSALQMQVMIRKRYSWSSVCEQDTETSSLTFYNAMHDIRYYFYGEEVWRGFEQADIDHKHGSFDARTKYHDDEHNGTFHMHMENYPAELTAFVIAWAQVIILSYFVLVLIHFILFSFLKP
jgi:hypothetical protein